VTGMVPTTSGLSDRRHSRSDNQQIQTTGRTGNLVFGDVAKRNENPHCSYENLVAIFRPKNSKIEEEMDYDL